MLVRKGLRCISATSGTSSQRSTVGRKLEIQDLRQRLRKVVDLIRIADDFAPFDRPSYNIALEIWKAVEAIPQAHRHRLLGFLTRGDILDLWRLAGQRYSASPSQLQTAIHSSFYAPDQFPTQPDQVVRFHGKAAVSLPYFNRFQKAFFCPQKGSGLHGRVLLGKGPLGDALYPLYYRATVGSHIIPATRELADLQLEYLPSSLLNLTAEDLPAHESWPQPGHQRPPFDGGLIDYCRAVGPDVWVGVGWKQDRPGPGERFLHFLLTREIPNADELVYDRPIGPRGWA
ncbi:hypothetical protein WJX74_001669 [Apatococcus lobatus]|uniref:Uncharacterized protein n=1 Tax=Apatococcus lobatus TaxID=904363 RepID=A0AAW1RW45_9CHLO